MERFLSTGNLTECLEKDYCKAGRFSKKILSTPYLIWKSNTLLLLFSWGRIEVKGIRFNNSFRFYFIYKCVVKMASNLVSLKKAALNMGISCFHTYSFVKWYIKGKIILRYTESKSVRAFLLSFVLFKGSSEESMIHSERMTGHHVMIWYNILT